MSERRQVTPGRPKLMTAADEARARYVDPEVTTKRGRQNIHYRQLAIAAFCNDPRFVFIADGKRMEAGDRGGSKPSILAELGRVKDEWLREHLALQVCRQQMQAKDAIPYIRRARTGKEAKPDQLALVAGIEKAINRYLAARPSTPMQMVADALTDIAQAIRDESEQRD